VAVKTLKVNINQNSFWPFKRYCPTCPEYACDDILHREKEDVDASNFSSSHSRFVRGGGAQMHSTAENLGDAAALLVKRRENGKYKNDNERQQGARGVILLFLFFFVCCSFM
jgi:hypothetical protein